MYTDKNDKILKSITDTIWNGGFELYKSAIKEKKNELTQEMLLDIINKSVNLYLFNFVDVVFEDKDLVKKLNYNSVEANKAFANLCKSNVNGIVFDFIQHPFLGKFIDFYEYDGDNFLRLLDYTEKTKDDKALHYLLIDQDYKLNNRLKVTLEYENRYELIELIQNRELYKKLQNEAPIKTEKKTKKI